MGRPAYPVALRGQVLAAIAAGASPQEAAARFRLSPSSVVRWQRLQDKTGSVRPLRRGGRSPLEPHTAWLLALRADNPHLDFLDIRQRILQGLGLKTSESSIRRFFDGHGIRFRKRTARQRAEPEEPAAATPSRMAPPSPP